MSTLHGDAGAVACRQPSISTSGFVNLCILTNKHSQQQQDKVMEELKGIDRVGSFLIYIVARREQRPRRGRVLFGVAKNLARCVILLVFPAVTSSITINFY